MKDRTMDIDAPSRMQTNELTLRPGTRSHEKRPHVLLVDDCASVRAALARVLERGGCDVEFAADANAAFELLGSMPIDVVVTDICMPGIDGMQLMRTLRHRAPDIPILIMTGAPSVDTAADAVRHGAFSYLTKPLAPSHLQEEVARAMRTHRERKGRAGTGFDPLRTAFREALSSCVLHYQPIVDVRQGRVHGYEALLRPRSERFPNPFAMLKAAEDLRTVDALGRCVRGLVIPQVHSLPEKVSMFVNLHSAELHDETLYDAESPFSQAASRIVLELTERASLGDLKDVRKRIDTLRGRGFRIALDDIGAGYSSLNSLALLEPEIVKVDMALVRDVDSRITSQKLIGTIVRLCEGLGAGVVAEGVETRAELHTLQDLGLSLVQGYLGGKPAAQPAPPNWTALEIPKTAA